MNCVSKFYVSLFSKSSMLIKIINKNSLSLIRFIIPITITSFIWEKATSGRVPYNSVADKMKVRIGDSPDVLVIQLNESHDNNTIFACQGYASRIQHIRILQEF